MTNRALIIGSQTYGLRGVDNDAIAINRRLKSLGFTTQLCIKKNASREGILTQYQKLITDSEEGDVAVIFYSGHGGLALNPHYEQMTAAGQTVPRYYQFIVPYDIDDSKPNDFRGITSLELSVLLTQLTEKTRNVTVILDCCHAARMVRDLDLAPKALQESWVVGIESHLEKLASQGMSTAALDIESNPHAVRLVAAGAKQSAYEYTNSRGVRTGILTESLLMVLKEAQDKPVSWQTVGTRIRERVLSIIPAQRPEIEGPSNRVLFKLDTIDHTDVLPVVFQNDLPILQGGRLMGVNVGDKYALVPMGVEKPTPETEIATATVVDVSGSNAIIDIHFHEGHDTISAGTNAFPISKVLPKLAVRVTGTEIETAQIRTVVDASDRLRVAADGEEVVLAQITTSNNTIDLQDRSGSYSLVETKAFSEAAVLETVHNLTLYARAQMLLSLESGRGASAFDNLINLEFGRVVHGQPQPLDEMAGLVAVGDRVYLKVSNHGANKVYLSVFDVGLSGKISLLTRSEPSGVEILPNEYYTLGFRRGIGLRGLQMGWTNGVPQDGPRAESFMAILSDKPQDLRPLQGMGMRTLGERLSPLQRMVDHIGLGGTRDVVDDDLPDVRYVVERIDFNLSPTPAT